jgi:hypothetical protein
MAVQFHQSALSFARGRYLKLALIVCATAIWAYFWVDPSHPYLTWGDAPTVYPKHYGGSPLGYILGTLAAALIIWLLLLGVRKRRYRSALGTLQGWTSAHIYLGTSLLIIASLHCAFEFGWNVHTAAYVLMVAVIFSGVLGIAAYLRYPRMMTDNMGEETLESLALTITDIDRECRSLALNLPDEVNRIVGQAARSRIGGGWWRRLKGDRVRCPTRAAPARLRALGARYQGEQAHLNQQLVAALARKSALLDRARRDLRLRMLMAMWLYFHVPLSLALLAALIAHVVSVFYFW